MELFHVHLTGTKDSIWVPKKEIFVKEDFNNRLYKRQQSFNINLPFADGSTDIYYEYMTFYMDQLNRKKEVKGEELEELKELLQAGIQLSYLASFFKREAALENCRKDKYPELPSRFHSIFLCDEDGLDYWNKIISELYTKEVEIYRVDAEKVFKSNESLLPLESSTYEEAYSQSFKYWHPRQKDMDNDKNEYLATGRIKVLERI